MSRLVRCVALAVLAGLAFAACGEATGVSGPQREQAQRADAICREVQSRVGPTIGDDPAAERDAVRSAADRFLNMNPPSENETTWTLFVQETNNLWLALEDLAQAQEANDRARADRARERVRDTNARIAERARDYGMTDCARGYTALS